MNELKDKDIVQIWMNRVLESRGTDKGKTLKYCQKIFNVGENTNNDYLMGFAQFYMGETYYILNDVEGLFLNSMNSVDNLSRSGQWELLAMAYNLLAIAFTNQGNTSFALDYYITGIKICEKYNLTFIKAIIECNIGILHMNHEEYDRAIDFLESSKSGFLSLERDKGYHTNITSVYTSLSKCFVEMGRMEEARQYLTLIEEEYEEHLDSVVLLCLNCYKSCYYNIVGDHNKRDHYIQEISENLNEELIILDIFDDFYSYCVMLLKIEKYDDFLKVFKVFDDVTRMSKLVYLQRKLLALKIEYMKKISNKSGYQEAAALYYELSQTMEQQEKYVISSMMENRFSLEKSKKKRREMEVEKSLLRQKSEMDALTGIANRFRLNDYAENAFQRALKNQSSFAIEILDVDYFKEYNDNYGHQAGDICLIRIADELRKMSTMRSVFCARYGGDEFVLLYEGYCKEDVFKMAEDLKVRMSQIKIEHKFSKAEDYVTLSQGICCDIPKKGNKVWDFLHSADVMLYKVKERSRNSLALSNCTGEEPKLF